MEAQVGDPEVVRFAQVEFQPDRQVAGGRMSCEQRGKHCADPTMLKAGCGCHVVLPLPNLIVCIEAEAFAFSNEGGQNWRRVSKHHGLHGSILRVGVTAGEGRRAAVDRVGSLDGVAAINWA